MCNVYSNDVIHLYQTSYIVFKKLTSRYIIIFRLIIQEFFLLLLREILNPDYGMFVQDEESHMLWFSEYVSELYVMS